MQIVEKRNQRNFDLKSPSGIANPILYAGCSSAVTHSDGAALSLTASRMAVAGFVQTKGLGLSLCSAM